MGQPQRPDDEISGTQVRTVGSGRYELGRQLGRGGMAEVSMAHDVRLGRTVAVKTLRPDLAQDPVARSRFGREAQNAASLNHPAIVSVYDTGEDRVGEELVPFIVMECVEGRTVRELLVEGSPIPQEQALRITEGVLEALEYSHRHGIIHRDIKPANVIITNSGSVKVMDFGIARAMHSAATTMTQTGMVMGTPQYLSPEQALGRTVDARSDLYSSGCLLYELLALRPPFNGDTPLSVVYQHVQDDPRPPSASVPGVPPHLDAITLKALAKNPDDRYQTAEEFRMDVRRALNGQAVHIAPTGAQTRTQPVWAPGATGTAATARLAGGPVPGNPEATGPMPSGPLGLPVNDGGTGAMPAVDERPRRRGGTYALVAALVIAVIAGVTIAVILLNGGDDNAGGAGGESHSPTAPTSGPPSTDTNTGPAAPVGDPEEDDSPSQPTRTSQNDSTRTSATYQTANPGGGQNSQPSTRTPTTSSMPTDDETTPTTSPSANTSKPSTPAGGGGQSSPAGGGGTPTGGTGGDG
ncbi:protein kinase [Yinghuangia sp. ASG 101]|uniref:protein kinase domain-containing protein n=1 Tax=Yinghuangia sp. ASG 101 TaxID=2896848 RepID=UPI001E49258F|nr:protein kinase [Yinghuangia sp. ASG 101]UGQ15228.1 protein kinase [Yinghuangia sp. ASG 101]